MLWYQHEYLVVEPSAQACRIVHAVERLRAPESHRVRFCVPMCGGNNYTVTENRMGLLTLVTSPIERPATVAWTARFGRRGPPIVPRLGRHSLTRERLGAAWEIPVCKQTPLRWDLRVRKVRHASRGRKTEHLAEVAQDEVS